MSRPSRIDDFFFPGQDPGLVYIGSQDAPMVPAGGARVRQIAASDSDKLNRRMRSRMEQRWRWPSKTPVFEVLSSPVLLSDVKVKRRKVSIGGKYLLSGAAGDRVWKSCLNKMDASEEEGLNAEFCRRRNMGFEPIYAVDGVSDKVPFVADMRNGYNFFHFLTELMPQLAVIHAQKSSAPVHISLPVMADLREFPKRFIFDIFPELKGRISFSDNVHEYHEARAVYNHKHYLYQANDPRIIHAVADLPTESGWSTIGSNRAFRKFLIKETFDSGMRLLRRAALARLVPQDLEGLPKRIWIGRDESASASLPRQTVGEAELLSSLSELGFAKVYLEHMSPLQQIATIHAADIIIAPHGAAFAHMTFARRSATVVELATPQTQLHRWGDFLSAAHVAGCSYTTIFADTEDGPVDDHIPSIEEGLKGIYIGQRALQAVVGIVERSGDALRNAAV